MAQLRYDVKTQLRQWIPDTQIKHECSLVLYRVKPPLTTSPARGISLGKPSLAFKQLKAV